MPVNATITEVKGWVVEVWRANQILAAAEARGGSYTAAELEAGRRRAQLSSWLSSYSEPADTVEAIGGLYRRTLGGVSYWILLDPDQSFTGETVTGWSFRNDSQGDGNWYGYTQANTTRVLNAIQRETGGIAPEYRPGGIYYPAPAEDIPGGGIYDPRTLEPLPLTPVSEGPFIIDHEGPRTLPGPAVEPYPDWLLPAGLGLLALLLWRR